MFSVQCFVDPYLSFFSFGHCIMCPSIYGFWLHLWYRLAIVLSVLPFTASDYTLVSFGHCIISPSFYGFWLHFGIFWPLYYQSFHLRLLITPLVSFGHCIISPSIYGFWLHLWYLLAIVLSVLPFTASNYTFDIFKLFFHMQNEDNNSPHISSSHFT